MLPTNHQHASFDRFPQLVRDLEIEFGRDGLGAVVERFVAAELREFVWDGRIAERDLGAYESFDDDESEGSDLVRILSIFRGRYRESLADPRPLTPGVPLAYSFALPQTNHVFLPGHRMMVQVQSSWFPLYDRNPQTYVPNIFFAKPADYVAARQQVVVAGPQESFVDLPVVR